MKKYITNYFKHYNICEGEFVLCEECGASAVDIHHIKKRSQGGGDEVTNLRALCRTCHNRYH